MLDTSNKNNVILVGFEQFVEEIFWASQSKSYWPNQLQQHPQLSSTSESLQKAETYLSHSPYPQFPQSPKHPLSITSACNSLLGFPILSRH